MIKFSFGFKLGLSIAIISLVAISSGLAYFYSITSDAVWTQMGKRLLDIGKTGQFLFNENDRQAIAELDRLSNEQSIPRTAKLLKEIPVGDVAGSVSDIDVENLHNSSAHKRIITIMRQIKNGTREQVMFPDSFPQVFFNSDDQPSIKYVYLVSAIAESPDYKIVKFLGDADFEEIDANKNGEIEDDEQGVNIGELYNIEDQEMLQKAFRGVATRSDGYFSDKWGTWYSSYIPIKDRQGQVLAVMGIDMDVNSELNLVEKLRFLLIALLSVSFILIIISSWLTARWLTRPLNYLRIGAEKMRQRDFNVSIPVKSNDEIGLLSQTFNLMVKEIRDYALNLEEKVSTRTHELEQTLKQVQKLKTQQDGDYFLTTLLTNPLFRNRNRSQMVVTEFYLEQKKKFQFKHHQGDLGGDLVITGNLNFNGQIHTMFFNGDAMGKSMQGAGGALVMGALVNSIMARSASDSRVLTISPQQWLQETYHEIQRVFESFDGSMMISCVMGVVHDQKGTLHYFNAEHPFSVLYRDGKASFLENEITVPKIGNPIHSDLGILFFQLQANDILICGSDGRDDLLMGQELDKMNENELQFLQIVEQAKADIKEIVRIIKDTGSIIDDLSLLRIAYNSGQKMPVLEKADPIIYREVIDLIKQKAYLKAESALDKVAEKRSFFYCYYKGLLMSKMDKNFEAIELLGEAREMMGEQAAVYRLLGRIYIKLNDKTMAKECLEQVVALDPQDQKSKAILQKL